MSEDGAPYIPQLYGRQQDKPLKKRQKALLDALLPKIAIADPAEAPPDLKALFPDKDEFWLEIGFGGGEHLAFQAQHNPSVGMIGAESFVNGVAKLLVHVDEGGLDNVRIRFGDARPLLEALPAASLSRLFVLYPDPWFKKRHWKRRIISPWFFNQAARAMRHGAELRVASDIPAYVAWTLMHARNAPDFDWTAACAEDWRKRPEDWPQTRYEAKAIKAGRRPAYLSFRRK